mgnify:CR=1 FL=1
MLREKRLKVGISACLLGMKYRYDGSSKFAKELVDALKEHVDFVPVCPETECGLGIPREPMHLELDAGGRLHLKCVDGSQELTSQMREWAECKLEILRALDIAAFILKARSPSCALRSALVVRDGRDVKRDAQGLFTCFLRSRFRTMPMFEETASIEEIKRALLIEK